MLEIQHPTIGGGPGMLATTSSWTVLANRWTYARGRGVLVYICEVRHAEEEDAQEGHTRAGTSASGARRRTTGKVNKTA